MNIGERVGDYEIVEVLGAGGMGQVYKVRNVISDRIEAMKILLPNVGSDPDLADRFLREIKVQAALDHSNIARLFTAQQAGDQLCMFMEFIDGSSLEKLLETGPLGLSDLLNVGSQVLDALAYAHAHGVIHRDIKPANIMRTRSGVVKLMDFGIARMQADRRLTQTGHTVGSLYYMSPEQIKGGEPDPRSDLYSLGVTMYEAVTGRKPFQGDSDYSIMAAHLEQTPMAPIEVVPGVPSDLSDILLMALAKDPAARFQNAEAFRGALRNIATAPHVATHTLKAPVNVPPPLPLPPPPAPQPILAGNQAGSRRGLYMALGSVATLVVLAAAVLEGPKLFRAPAAQSVTAPSAPITVTPTAPLPVQDTVQEPVHDTVQAPVARPQTPNPVSPALSPTPQVPAKPQPQPAQSTPQAPTVPPAAQIVPPAQQPTPTPVPVSAQPRASAEHAEQMNELRKDYNLLSIRVSGAKNGLRSMQQSMQRQGLNLRGDMLDAENRMDYQMKEAMDSMRSGDAEQARSALQMAERALETIEKFLGR